VLLAVFLRRWPVRVSFFGTRLIVSMALCIPSSSCVWYAAMGSIARVTFLPDAVERRVSPFFVLRLLTISRLICGGMGRGGGGSSGLGFLSGIFFLASCNYVFFEGRSSRVASFLLSRSGIRAAFSSFAMFFEVVFCFFSCRRFIFLLEGRFLLISGRQWPRMDWRARLHMIV